MKHSKAIISITILFLLLITTFGIVGNQHRKSVAKEAASESSKKAASESSKKAASESSKKAASESSEKAASESNARAFISSIDQQASQSSANKLSQSTPLSKNAKSYLKKVNKLSEGTAQFATYDEDMNELTYVGYDSWFDYSHSDLQSMMDILETIANRQAVAHNIHNPSIEVKLPDGTLIAESDGIDDIEFVN